MPDFSKRSRKEELLDQPNLDRNELFKNLAELDTINRLLGGHQATLKGLKQLMKNPEKTYHIVDFACGGGDTLRIISKWAKRNNRKVKLYGFDLLEDAILFAKENSKGFNIEFQVADFKNYNPKHRVDISVCSLVCHHFYDDLLLDFLRTMHNLADVGIVINDLHRNSFAYYSIKWLTIAFSKSTYVKNDAPLSVLKGFNKEEWRKMFQDLGWQETNILWVWAFRHLIYLEHGENL